MSPTIDPPREDRVRGLSPQPMVLLGAVEPASACSLHIQEIELMMRVSEHGGVLAQRNRALVAVLGLCGLRLEEALGLATADVTMNGATLAVRTGEAPRRVTIPPDALDALEAWLGERSALPAIRGPKLFTTRNGADISPSYVREMLPRLARQAGLSAPMSAGRLRRAHAGELVLRGWPLDDIQMRLGYRTSSATRRFLLRAGIPIPECAATQGPRANVLLQQRAPCRTCLHGDALEDDAVPGLLDDSPDAVLTADHEGTVRSANEMAEILLGMDGPPLVGRSLWEILTGPQHAPTVDACREALATRRASWAVEKDSPSGETSTLARVTPTAGGIALWVRDELGLRGLTSLAAQLSALAHGSVPGSTMLLRAIRKEDRQIIDFLVAAAHSTREGLFFTHASQIVRRRISEVFPMDRIPGVMGSLLLALSLQQNTRLRLHVQDPQGAVVLRIVPLTENWLVIAVQDAPAPPPAPI